MNKDTLILPIKGEWYRKILEGVKPDEYRDIKPYYTSRLKNADGTYKQFKYIKFINGYGNKRPYAVFECKGISEGLGDTSLGAPFVYCYIISIGKLISSTKN